MTEAEQDRAWIKAASDFRFVTSLFRGRVPEINHLPLIITSDSASTFLLKPIGILFEVSRAVNDNVQGNK